MSLDTITLEIITLTSSFTAERPRSRRNRRQPPRNVGPQQGPRWPWAGQNHRPNNWQGQEGREEEGRWLFGNPWLRSLLGSNAAFLSTEKGIFFYDE